MADSYLIFQSFHTVEEAIEIAELLRKDNIDSEIENSGSRMASIIIGSPAEANFRLKLRAEDFTRAHTILESQYNELGTISEEYYLYNLTNKELLDIIAKPDEWGYLDFKLAQKILEGRGAEIKPEEITQLKSKRINELSKPDEIKSSWVILGYVLALVFSPFGIVYGAMISSLKKVLPNGVVVYSYNPKSRKHGEAIMIIAMVFTTLYLIRIFSK